MSATLSSENTSAFNLLNQDNSLNRLIINNETFHISSLKAN